MIKQIVILLILSTISCEQKKNENMKTEKDIYNIYKEVKHFEKDTKYQVVVASNQCSYEILVNDMPVYQFFHKLSGGPAGDVRSINTCISKAGKQKLTIKMYPGYDINKEEFKDMLGANAGVKVTIEKDEEEIQIITTPQINIGEGKMRFPYPEKKYYEENLIFEADVPYKVADLVDSDILLTNDSKKLKKLEEELVEKYNQIRNIYLNGTKDEIANLYYEREKRFAQQEYLSKDKIITRWDNEILFRTNSNITFFDIKAIENYKLKFYGDGKIVTLLKTNNNESSLWGGNKIKGEDDFYTMYFSIDLHRPKGSKEFVVY
jgi:hypothetical protein